MQAIRRMLMEKWWDLVGPLAIFAVTLALAWGVRRFALGALKGWAGRKESRPGIILSEALHGPTMVWVFIVALHPALQALDLSPKTAEWAAEIIAVLWITSLTLMGARLAGDLVRHYGDQVPGALPVTTLTQTLAQIAVVALGVVLLMSSLGLRITPILTALGVGGLAVALALQDTLSNLFGGFYVAVARQIRLGDYIRLSSGEEGYVSDIGWRSTTIRALANNVVIIPNAKLAQAIVTNFYLPERRMSSSVSVAVPYDCDPDHIEQILLEIGVEAASEVPGLLAEPAPGVSFDPGFGEYALGFTLNYHIAEFANQYGVRHELRKRIFRRFRAEGIEIPYPARSVYLRELDSPGPEKPGSRAAHP